MDAPIPVVVQEPLAVTIKAAPVPAAGAPQSQLTDPSKPATTTYQQDLTTAGQRQVNLIWERTQAAIALMVVVATMMSGLFAMIHPYTTTGTGNAMSQLPIQIPTIISVAFGTVVGFYFSRTNHAAIGGIGDKPESPYVGR